MNPSKEQQTSELIELAETMVQLSEQFLRIAQQLEQTMDYTDIDEDVVNSLIVAQDTLVESIERFHRTHDKWIGASQ